MSIDFTEHPHRRYNPLTGQYVLVSPHRTKRPWQGKVDPPSTAERPQYDKTCYLCPGNQRAGKHANPQYESTFVFTNDFRALLEDTPLNGDNHEELLRYEGVQGTSRVICFSPRHDLTLPEMQTEAIRRVVDVWAEQVRDLSSSYNWVQVFENKGAIMGCSNPHPHGQVWAGTAMPNEPKKEDVHQMAYFRKHGKPLLLTYAGLEMQKQERVVVENDLWLAVVPFWAVWPFETLLLPKFAVRHLPELSPAQRDALADILKQHLIRYDNLFETSFPYSMGWHGQPFNGDDNEHWQLHAHFYPPLLRSASVQKFMVGYELMAEAQRDLTAEQAAQRLAALPETHYRERLEV